MKIDEFAGLFPQKLKEITDFTRGEDIKDIIGIEAINHFKNLFENEGSTHETLHPWKLLHRIILEIMLI